MGPKGQLAALYGPRTSADGPLVGIQERVFQKS